MKVEQFRTHSGWIKQRVWLVVAACLFMGIQSTLTAQDARQVAQVDSTIDLKQAIEIALANSSEIKQAMFSVMDADQQELAAWGEVMPTVTADMSYQRNLELPVNFVPATFFDPNAPADELIPLKFGADNNWSGGISVSQTLFRGEAIIGIASSELYLQAQQENYRATAQQVVTQTRIAYYNVLNAQEKLDLQEATIERLRQNLNDNKQRVKAGLADDYDVLQIEIQLRNQIPNLSEAQNEVDRALRNLNITLGLPVYMPISVVGDLEKFRINESAGEDLANQVIKEVHEATPVQFFEGEQVLKQNLKDARGDLRALKYRSDLQDKRITADYSKFLPTLSANYRLGWNASQNGDPIFFGTDQQRARSQVLGISLNWNLFDGLAKSTVLQRSKIEKKSIEEQRNQTLQNAIDQVFTARDNLNRVMELIPSLQDGVDLAERGYQRAKARLENGLGSQLEVTDAEVQLRQAQQNYASAIYAYLSAKAQYDQAVGMVPFIDIDFKSN